MSKDLEFIEKTFNKATETHGLMVSLSHLLNSLKKHWTNKAIINSLVGSLDSDLYKELQERVKEKR